MDRARQASSHVRRGHKSVEALACIVVTRKSDLLSSRLYSCAAFTENLDAMPGGLSVRAFSGVLTAMNLPAREPCGPGVCCTWARTGLGASFRPGPGRRLAEPHGDVSYSYSTELRQT